MSDWVKILVSALAGLIAGILSTVIVEPLKSNLTLVLKSRRARKAIHNELLNIYMLFSEKSGDADFFRKAFEDNLFNIFDFYFENEREAVFQIPHWQSLQTVYKAMKDTVEKVLAGQVEPTLGAKQIIIPIKTFSEFGLIDKVLPNWASRINR